MNLPTVALLLLQALWAPGATPSVLQQDVLHKAPSAVANRAKLMAASRDIKETDYPFVVSVGYVQDSYYLLQCAGTILDKNHILSTAHCFQNTSSPKSYLVRAGSDFWRYDGQAVPVAAIYKMPLHDVAVVRLSQPLNLTAKFADATVISEPIDLTQPGKTLTVLGWGFTKVGATAITPKDLRSSSFTTVEARDCHKHYKAMGKEVAPWNFCAAGPSCEGEFGDPVIDPRNKHQIGITSFGFGCKEETKTMPQVFVNLADPEIRKFITAQLKK